MREDNLSFKYLIEIFKRKLPLTIVITILFMIISFMVNEYVITPKYTGSVSMIINNKNADESDKIIASELDANKKLVTTYSDILNTRGVVNNVIEKLNLNISYEDLRERMNVYSENNNEIFTLEVEDTNPERATDIANQTATIFKEAVQKIMNIDNVQILDKAVVPQKKSSPSTILNTVLVGLITFVVTMFIAISRELFDTSIKNSEDASEYFDLPVIGIIPDRKQG